MKKTLLNTSIALMFSAVSLTGCGGSGTDSPKNIIPVANAGIDQNVSTGNAVTLDASSSTDADGDTLSYSWSLTSLPTDSTASLSDSSSAVPTFTVDLDGSYVAQLIVNDGTEDSVADTITIVAETANSAPVANAGIDQNVSTGNAVTLDASSSTDADGDTLSYSWSLTSLPTDSTASLSDSSSAVPTFTVDLDGSYVAQLIVNDGTEDSVADTITIVAETANSAPVANAGIDQNVSTGNAVTLDASSSTDADGDALSFSWTFVSIPETSSAVLFSENEAEASFVPDVDGSFIIQIKVSDGLDVATDNIAITAKHTSITLLYQNPIVASWSEKAMPYSSSGTATVNPTTGFPIHSFGNFALRARGKDYVISNLTATDSNLVVYPEFRGLVDGQIIADGETVEFYLRSSLPGDSQANVNFYFEIEDTNKTFSFSRIFSN